MGVDRIVLGTHANAAIGQGLYVTKPTLNVMDPQIALSGNLMFDSNEPFSSINVIQSGTFKITCSREAISPRGENIGTRKNDVFTIKPITQDVVASGAAVDLTPDLARGDSSVHTFDHDTGRPSALNILASEQQDLVPFENSPFNSSSGQQAIGSQQGNYLDRGTETIAIASPLSRGQIPQVSLRFAVGNSSGHFHPWYANTVRTGSGGDWSDIDYTSGDTQQIVHMDSNWMRLKWGGLGAEKYGGVQDTFDFDTMTQFFGGNSDDVVDAYGFDTEAEMKEKIGTNSKILSLALSNAKGVVGLIPYINSTSITVDAYMTPTHAGLRRPTDRTFDMNAGKQKGIGYNAIDDYAQIKFPIEDHDHTKWYDRTFFSGYIRERTDKELQEEVQAHKFQHLPYVPDEYYISSEDNYDAPMNPINSPDNGKRDLYGWGGHPTDFFVNPFSNSTCTFYTHMQPPYLHNYSPNTSISGHTYTGHYLPIEYENLAGEGVEGKVWGPDWDSGATDSENSAKWHIFRRGVDWTDRYPGRTIFSPGGVSWPPGHEHSDFYDHRDWTGSMGLAGAGSKEAMATDDVWDTFYCSYVVYSHGAAPIFVSPQTPKTITIDMRSSEFFGGMLQNPDKYRNDRIAEAVDGTGTQRYFNLVFPDDFVGTIGEEATDPFWKHRNYDDPQKRIYGNVNILFKIPFTQDDTNPTYAKNYVYVGSESFTYDISNLGGVEYPGKFGRPDPAITFVLDDTKFIFENNKDLTLAIENSGYVLGGGGSGGAGERSAFVKGGELGDEESYGGGGGGAGGGSGYLLQNFIGPAQLYGAYLGTGMGGYGFGEGPPSGIIFETENITENQWGESGAEIAMQMSDPLAGWNSGPAGGFAASIQASSMSIAGIGAPGAGGDGGDAFYIKHGSVLPTIEIINKPNDYIFSYYGPPPKRQILTGDATQSGAVLASGGGGGGGGVGKLGLKQHNSSGKSGGMPGEHGNTLRGQPSHAPVQQADHDFGAAHQGGLAGYLVGSSQGGAYAGNIRVRNESRHDIRARHPSETPERYTTTPGASSQSIGFIVPEGETKEYR